MKRLALALSFPFIVSSLGCLGTPSPLAPGLAGSVGWPYHGVQTGAVELPEAGGIRMLGNLLGDAAQTVTIGAEVEAVFEPHDDAATPYTLVQWRTV